MTGTFAASEVSNFGGRPQNLYKFQRGNLNYLYCESDRDVTIGPDTYSSVDVSDEGVSLSGNATKDTFEITIPSSAAVVQLYRGTAPSDTVYVTVRRYHPGDADAAVYYVGNVVSVAETTPGLAKISCAALTGSFKRDGVRLAWTRSCPYSLFDRNCRVPIASYAFPGVVTAVNGNVANIPAASRKPDTYFAGGFLQWTVGLNTYERRGIEQQTGGTINIFGQGDGIVAGLAVTMYPGCARIVSVCQTKFNNFANYGGVPMLPGKSPFDNDPVF